MPRRRRKSLLLVDEDLAREDREEGYRRLLMELQRSWRSRRQVPISRATVADAVIDNARRRERRASNTRKHRDRQSGQLNE